MEHFKLSYGLDESDALILAECSSCDGFYQCPSCKTKLTLTYEDIREPYFLHATNTNCNVETALYETAKPLIKESITHNFSGLKTILLRNNCHCCGNEFYSEMPPGTFIGGTENVEIEEHKFDFIAYRKNKINYLAIKVISPHSTDNKKNNNLNTHWIELSPKDVVQAAYEWKPTSSNLKPSYCKFCKNVRDIVNKSGGKLRFYSSETTHINPKLITHYVACTETCFACKAKIPVYWWKGVPFSDIQPPNPRPKTIKYRFSKRYKGSYWLNTCANCGITQGDNFLFILQNAPFKELPLTEKSKQNYGNVMISNLIGFR